MALKTTHAAALCAVLLAGGCSFAEESLFPASGTVQTGTATAAPPPALGSSNFDAPGVTSGAATGTYVGQKVTSLRGDLQQLQAMLTRHNQTLQAIRNDTVQDSQRYHGTVAAVNARLQVGTTPGNPILNQQWNAAQGELDRINEDVLKMTRLANEVTSSSALSAYLLESVRAARQLSGAVDEDHRQLRILEDETNRTVVLIERLLTELSDDINRQQNYVANERTNLNTLALAIKNGQLYGSSFAARPGAGFAPASFDAPVAAPRAAVTSDTPLVTIRFDKPNVSYESALYAAVKGALDRRPSASFDVIAVSPTGATPGSQALGATAVRRNAESVVRSLTNMGLPSSRIRVSQTTSAAAQTGEVQVFVR
ncbi:MAG TPA: hypothetical protein VL974_10320 [Magnetospirillum sp.]|jgi:hypothetical protein|nr:hypothetical protein [Magnetospirillum sp.]